MNFTASEHHDTSHKGHAVLATGASRGVGRTIASSFAQASASEIAIAARTNLDAVESTILSPLRLPATQRRRS
ncbi:hypothetical protein MAP00_007642 [Monascus purpureus]|nr:hypothetical protein MAP00_007642 [Monascus purpureus]